MKVALAVSHQRMAPAFSGAQAVILGSESAYEAGECIDTAAWHPLMWGRELMRYGVEVLLCSGIDHGTWSAVQGSGVCVVPNVVGEAGEVWKAWRRGEISPPPIWPANPGCLKRRRRRRGGPGRPMNGPFTKRGRGWNAANE